MPAITLAANFELSRRPICPLCGDQLHPLGFVVSEHVAICKDCINEPAPYLGQRMATMPDHTVADLGVTFWAPKTAGFESARFEHLEAHLSATGTSRAMRQEYPTGYSPYAVDWEDNLARTRTKHAKPKAPVKA